MFAGIMAGIAWTVETTILGIALAMAPFAWTFLHDAFSAIWSCIYNGVKENCPELLKRERQKAVDLYR